MNWTNVLNTVQLALYVAGIIVLILIGSQIVSSQADIPHHSRIIE